MANKLDKELNKAIDEVLKNYNAILQDAVEHASDIAVKDIWTRAQGCLEEYYDNYEPNIYKRTDNLWHAIVPYLKTKTTKNKITNTVGVEYDSSVLNMYNGSQKYSPTDGDWILNNYLAGIHPGTDGGTYYDPYLYGQVDDISPEQKMETYLNNYNQIVSSNILMYFISEIGKRM